MLTKWCGLLVALLLTSPALANGKVVQKKPVPPAVPGFVRPSIKTTNRRPPRGAIFCKERSIACNATCPSNRTASSSHSSPAPILDGVGQALERSYLRKFLSDPQAVKPGTTMPNLFAGMDEGDKKERSRRSSTSSLRRARAAGTARQQGHRHRPRSVPQGRLRRLPRHARRQGRRRTRCCRNFGAAGRPQGEVHARQPGGVPGEPASDAAVGPDAGLCSTTRRRATSPTTSCRGPSAACRRQNMTYAYYEGAWTKLPDFAKLKPMATGEASRLRPRRRPARQRLRHAVRGLPQHRPRRHYTVPSHQRRRQQAVDRRQARRQQRRRPSAAARSRARPKLTKGIHKSSSASSRAAAGSSSTSRSKALASARQPLRPRISLSARRRRKPAASPDDGHEDDSPLKPELVEKGKELFASLGLRQLPSMQERERIARARPPLAKLKAEGGCLAQSRRRACPGTA